MIFFESIVKTVILDINFSFENDRNEKTLQQKFPQKNLFLLISYFGNIKKKKDAIIL